MTPPVTVYTVPKCSSCEAVKRYLHKRGVPLTKKNTRGDPAALAEMQSKAKVTIAPVTEVGAQAFYGTLTNSVPQ